ncbi:MAG TPA: hypothetical protein VFR24_25195 [Candidatus Angelobacter sp.]|nr:hypothetical protein [Candidatus Angelobacter sp.]
MSCSRCGRFTLFRNLCWTCAKNSSGQQIFSGFHTSRHVKWQWQARILKVNVNGRESTFDAAAGLGEEVLQELAGHLGIPVTNLQQLLHTGHEQQSLNSTISTESAAASVKQSPQATKKIVMIDCPKCHHRIAKAAWCLYCGQELSETTCEQSKTNEVDRAFLTDKVKSENKAQPQLLHDTFSDRLKDI